MPIFLTLEPREDYKHHHRWQVVDEEAGIERWEMPEAVSGLRARGLIEYWELQPAVRLTPGGLEIVLRFSEEGNA